MSLPAVAQPIQPDPLEALEAEVNAAIAVCDGDVRAALRATLVANAYLDSENQRLTASLSTGYDRQRIRKLRKPLKIQL
jgi:hypothetical protein